jgi:hypothetical protein
MKAQFTTNMLVLAFATHFSYAAGFADAPPPAEIDKTRYSPYPEQNYPNQVLFGDTHLHTSYSEEIYHVTSIPL